MPSKKSDNQEKVFKALNNLAPELSGLAGLKQVANGDFTVHGASDGLRVEYLNLLLNLMRELLHSGVINYLLVNLLGLRQGNLSLRPLLNALHQSDCAVVLLLPASVRSDSASLRLQIQRQKWLQQNGDIIGCLSSVRVEKHRSGNTGTETLLLLPFEREAWV